MVRINSLPPPRMTTRQVDIPGRDNAGAALGASDSRELIFLVLLYLVAMFVGILLLGALTPTSLDTTTAAIGRAQNR